VSVSILQINFTFSGSRAEYEAASLPNAAPIAAIPGLGWKIWLINTATSEAGGIYRFDDENTAEAFAKDVEVMLRGNPSFGNISVKQFGVIETLTAITRGPISQPSRARTFNQMAAEALAAVPSITPDEARRRLEQDPNTLVIDVRDAADIAQTGTVPGAVNLSLGALTYLADNEVPEDWRDPRLADRSRPIITTCILGPMGALGGKLLHDMGFSNVQILKGGVQAWIDAGLPVTDNRVG